MYPLFQLRFAYGFYFILILSLFPQFDSFLNATNLDKGIQVKAHGTGYQNIQQPIYDDGILLITQTIRIINSQIMRFTCILCLYYLWYQINIFNILRELLLGDSKIIRLILRSYLRHSTKRETWIPLKYLFNWIFNPLILLHQEDRIKKKIEHIVG